MDLEEITVVASLSGDMFLLRNHYQTWMHLDDQTGAMNFWICFLLFCPDTQGINIHKGGDCDRIRLHERNCKLSMLSRPHFGFTKKIFL